MEKFYLLYKDKLQIFPQLVGQLFFNNLPTIEELENELKDQFTFILEYIDDVVLIYDMD